MKETALWLCLVFSLLAVGVGAQTPFYQSKTLRIIVNK